MAAGVLLLLRDHHRNALLPHGISFAIGALFAIEFSMSAEPALTIFNQNFAVVRDTVPLVRIAAAESLGKLADPAAMDKLVPLLRDQDPIARAIAARSLHRLGWRPNTDTLKIQQILAIGNLHQLVTMGPEAVEPLLELMRYGSPNKQLAAVKTLG